LLSSLSFSSSFFYFCSSVSPSTPQLIQR
jgi:hypothetical protein